MMDLRKIRKKPARFVIGLMSGSSCDGVDAALVRLKGTGPSLVMKLIDFKTVPFTTGFRIKLLNEHLDAKEVCLLNFELGKHMADAANEMIDAGKEQGIKVDFIASHGHTVAHYPPPGIGRIGTLQIGEPAVIAEETGLGVVSDFRARDMAAGGQGAPLVAYADWLLFRKLNQPVLCINLGGIVNFTVVTPEFDDIIAFDSGPGNMAIDGVVRQLTRGERDMDTDGKAAKMGIVIDEFLKYLLGHKFLRKVPPKSTGREDFGAEVYLRDALASRREHSYEDLVATVTEAVAKTVIEAYERFVKPHHDVEHVIVSGGGAKNKVLMRLLGEGMPGAALFTSDQYGIPDGAREAIAFAILGNETICGTPANVPKSTGAKHPVILGKITPV